MDFSVVIVIRTLIPAVVVAVLVSLHACRKWKISRRHAVREGKAHTDGAGVGAEGSKGVWEYICEQSGAWAFAIVFLIYPSTSSVVLSYFQCMPVEGGMHFLRADFSIDCDSSSYATMRLYAVAMLLLYPVGVPLLFWWLLSR